MIAKAFPAWTPQQTDVLMDRFAANSFTDERMMDSVTHVIDTYEGYGKIPNIANFIQYDKQVTYYTHRRKDFIVSKGEYEDKDFAIARIEGVSGCRSADESRKPILYVLRVDAAKYKIPTLECKPLAGWTD